MEAQTTTTTNTNITPYGNPRFVTKPQISELIQLFEERNMGVEFIMDSILMLWGVESLDQIQWSMRLTLKKLVENTNGPIFFKRQLMLYSMM